MKKLYMMALLLAFSGACAGHKKIVIDSPMLAFVDGTPFIDINEIIYFGHNVKIIVDGGSGKDIKKLIKRYGFDMPAECAYADAERYGMLYFDGAYRTLKEMVEIEKNVEDFTPEMHEVLLSAQDLFGAMSRSYLDEIRGAKGYMVNIIESWSEQRNRPDSELLVWSRLDGDEEESLRASMTSFRKLDVFFADLLLFLSDLVQSCPKSWSSYVKMIKELRANKK